MSGSTTSASRFDVIDREFGGDLIKPLAPGLWAVNRDGSDTRQLVEVSAGPVIVKSHVLSDRSCLGNGGFTASSRTVRTMSWWKG